MRAVALLGVALANLLTIWRVSQSVSNVLVILRETHFSFDGFAVGILYHLPGLIHFPTRNPRQILANKVPVPPVLAQ